MNPSTISLIRGILKLAAGALLAKGYGDESSWEEIIGGILAVATLMWGWMQRGKAPPAALVLLLATLPALAGCSMMRISNAAPNGSTTTVTAYVPAWPWQDSSKTIEKLTVSARAKQDTNYFSASLKGLDETETTSTNAGSLIESVIGAAIRAAK